MASSNDDGGSSSAMAVLAPAAAAAAGGSPPATCPPPSPESAPAPVRRYGLSDWENLAVLFGAFVSLTNHFANLALDHVAEGIQRLIEKKGEDDTCHVPLILEVAGGTGSCALEAARRFPQARVLLTDISDAMLNAARKKVAESAIASVEVKMMDGQDLQVADESVDALICIFGIMFFADRSRGWREMQRVLRPGGKAAIITWTTPGPHLLTDEAIAKYDAEMEEKEKEEEGEGSKEEGMPRGEEGQGEAGEGVAAAIADADSVPVAGDTGKTNDPRSSSSSSSSSSRRLSLEKMAMADETRKQVLRLGYASAIADDLAAAGCHFSKVEIFPSLFVWKGIGEGEIDMMSSLWEKMPALETWLAGRDFRFIEPKLKEVMRGRVDQEGHVCVPCKALLTVLTK